MTCCQVTTLLCKIIQTLSSSSKNYNNTQLLWIIQLQVYSAPHVLKETSMHPANDQSSVVSTRLLYVNWKEICAHSDTAGKEKNIWNHYGPGDTWTRHRQKHGMENSYPLRQKLQIHFRKSQKSQSQLAVILLQCFVHKKAIMHQKTPNTGIFLPFPSSPFIATSSLNTLY